MNHHLAGKELFIRFAVCVFRECLSISVFASFPFGFDGWMWDLTQELGCIFMSPAHQSSILTSIKSIISVFVTAFSTPLYLCPMNRHKIC